MSAWQATPFGACLAVWARVGGDPNTTTNNLNNGWWLTAADHLAGVATLSIPAGWSTVYFPVIKNAIGTSSDPYAEVNLNGTLFPVWRRGGGYLAHGALRLGDIPNVQAIDVPDYRTYGRQFIYPSMLYPVVCYSAQGQTVSVELWRDGPNGNIILGRPIVLGSACSWFSHQ